MPVQRVFTARGFGTILTGIPVSGSVQLGDVVEILPGGQKGKLRGIQAYHESAKVARAGHSTALNIADVDHHEIERGHVVAAPGFFKPQTGPIEQSKSMFDIARLRSIKTTPF